ncbi:S26 family signal peptidase [Streptomyces varsoviensis]|uniref:S26 family signal peptidase n=1 Tax=Streptomyces varsoviensis TaxID=67373 RepID=UPI0033D2A361
MRPAGRRMAPFAFAFAFAFVFVVAPLLSLLLARRRFAVITVAGASMEPAYTSGDRVLIRRLGRGGGGRVGNRADEWVGRRIGKGSVVVATWRPPSGHPPEDLASTSATPTAHQAAADQQPDGSSTARSRLIKRVVAGPGDPVPEGLGPALGAEAGRPVPPDSFVVLGDNAAHSHDSRHTGYLRRDDIVGLVIRRLARGR